MSVNKNIGQDLFAQVHSYKHGRDLKEGSVEPFFFLWLVLEDNCLRALSTGEGRGGRMPLRVCMDIPFKIVVSILSCKGQPRKDQPLSKLWLHLQSEGSRP